MNGKTLTSVHSEAAMFAQRWRACVQEQCALQAAGVYAQLYIGMALYLYAHVSTAGYLSILLTAPYLLLIWGLALFVSKRTGPEGIGAILGAGAAKAFYLLAALVYFLDAQLIFYALCAILRDVMPGQPPVFLAVCAALAVPLGLACNQESVPARVFRPMKWVIAGLLLYCAATSLPYGNAAYFFPLLGAGSESILTGGAWMCGAVSAGVFPLLTVRNEESHGLIQEKKGILLGPLLFALGAAVVTYGLSVWLSPFYTLARPEDLGWRLLLPVHMTPSVPAWSMMVLGLLLLFLLALSNCVSQASRLLARCAGKKEPPTLLYFLLPMALVPAGVLATEPIQDFLADIAPGRALLVLATLAVLAAACLLKKKKAPASEAS